MGTMILLRRYGMRSGRAILAMLGLWASATGCGLLPFSRTSRSGAELIESAAKPAPVDSTFNGCGPVGSQPDYPLNARKNRIDEGVYVPVPWIVAARLPWPRQVGYRFRNQWGSGERNQVARYEGAAVRVQGYLIGYRLEIPEPPNCYSHDADQKDYHMWLADSPDATRAHTIVVELTPRVRVNHPQWTDERLAALVQSRSPVRVSGWLMLDQMHPELVGRNRATLWEVHPIMQLEWQGRDSAWVSLDSLSPLSAR
jgi:hypothetical protein